MRESRAHRRGEHLDGTRRRREADRQRTRSTNLHLIETYRFSVTRFPCSCRVGSKRGEGGPCRRSGAPSHTQAL